VREEGIDFGSTHPAGMALVAKKDEASYPLHVGSFGLAREILDANGIPHAIQELLGRGLGYSRVSEYIYSRLEDELRDFILHFDE